MGLRLAARPRVDVLFYTPFIGHILGDGDSSPPGGAETQILMLSKSLVERGACVAIVAYGRPDELPTWLDGVRIVPRPPCPPNKRLAGKLLEIYRLWRSVWLHPSHTVVYRGTGPELGLIALFTWITRRRLVFSAANAADFEPRRLLQRRSHLRLYRLGVRGSDEIVVQTEDQVELCQRAFDRRSRLIKSLAALADPQCGPPEAFLWVGRLVSYKRPLAYVALARAVPEARFWMVGVPADGDDLETPLAEVKAAASDVPNLEFLAPRTHEEIGLLMARAVASVNTADFEGMPNTLLEGWCRGVPALVLNYDPGGVVASRGLGAFAGGSPDRLVALARAQWQSREDRADLQSRCRDYVAEQHSIDRVAAQWLGVLAITPRAMPPDTASSSTELRCVA